MKLSLRWIFDHLQARVDDYTVEDVVKKLITSTAEVEAFYPVTYNSSEMTVAQVIEISEKNVTLFSKEENKNYTVPFRTDVQMGSWYFINTKRNMWITFKEWHSEKEGLLPAFSLTDEEILGGWKKVLCDDHILEIDNKSITNRPDLWGHRGFARELSVLYGVSLIDDTELYADLKKIDQKNSWTIENKSQNTCFQLAVLPLSGIAVTPSLLFVGVRLALVDGRPINNIVDLTNYVMLDIGHPMHAFDAAAFSDKHVYVQKASHGETLELLDGSKIVLTPDDTVIANSHVPLSLAGIKGGTSSGVSERTQEVLLEAAVFDATAIRLAAARHKLRTDASARFEKTLDQEGNKKAIERFVRLAEQCGMKFSYAGPFLTWGDVYAPVVITVVHSEVEEKIGKTIGTDTVVSILTGLGKKVSVSYTDDQTVYRIEVPSYRASKDIRIPEDIIEEVARVIGYDTITPVMPLFRTQPHRHAALYKTRKIKQYLAYTMHLSEVENYALFDNSFIKKIGYTPVNPLQLKNPLTEERTTLVTSLIPHLLQNALQEYEHVEECGFFEWARLFSNINSTMVEHKVLAGIVYNKKEVDFYVIKEQIKTLCQLAGYDVDFKVNVTKPWWSASYKLIDVWYQDTLLGTIGQLSEQLTSHFNKGKMICFELGFGSLLNNLLPVCKAAPLNDVPAQYLDVSCMVNRSVTVEELTRTIMKAHEVLVGAMLIDTYHKEDWGDKKSVTFTCTVRGEKQPLSKEELEIVQKEIYKVLEAHGGMIR